MMSFVRKRIYATTCYLNLLEKYLFLTKLPEISRRNAIIFNMMNNIAFRILFLQFVVMFISQTNKSIS